MCLTYLKIAVIAISFILTIIEKFFLDKRAEPNGINTKHSVIFRLIKSKYALIFLVGGLLIVQSLETILTANVDKEKDKNTSLAHTQISETSYKVNKVNEKLLSIDSLLNDIDTTLKNTKNELHLISNVNEDVKVVRDGIEKNLAEFNSIKSQYEKQIEIERQKIDEAKPNLRVLFPKSIIDSLNFAYQFQLENNGTRMADSIIYYSIMVFMDTNSQFYTVDLYKSNDIETNILSIPGKENSQNSYLFNSNDKNRIELLSCEYAYLLVKYKYNDIMTSKSDGDFEIFLCQSLEKGNQQYGHNVTKRSIEIIKANLLLKYKKYYDIFFND